MNKKIIITLVAIITVSIGALVGVNAYKNSKQEVPQKTVEIAADNKVVEDNKEKVATAEEKKDTEVVLDAEKAQAVFQSFQNAICNIDYKNEEQVKKQEEILKEVVHPVWLDIVKKEYTEDGKKNPYKATLTSLQINEIEAFVGCKYIKNGNDVKGFKITYSYSVNVDGKNEEVKNKYADVVFDNNKYTVVVANQ